MLLLYRKQQNTCVACRLQHHRCNWLCVQ